MELSNLFPIAQPLKLVFPDGEETGITFMIVGRDSREARAVERKIGQTVLARGPNGQDVHELEQMNVELLAACVTGWNGLTENGEPIPFSKAKATELLAMPELTFIREQVEAFVLKRANFFRRNTEAA